MDGEEGEEQGGEGEAGGDEEGFAGEAVREGAQEGARQDRCPQGERAQRGQASEPVRSLTQTPATSHSADVPRPETITAVR